MQRKRQYIWSYWLSMEGLQSTFMLKALLWINGLGTVYGYYWYWAQMERTVEEHPLWRVFLVPDSPTGSLFFFIAILWLLLAPNRDGAPRWAQVLRSVIEALAVVTSFKYGIWAVAIIIAGWSQGDAMYWEQWMLIASHLGMAVEAVLFAPIFGLGLGSIGAAAAWTVYNDYADYSYGIYPSLPSVLQDDVEQIGRLTSMLSIISILVAYISHRLFRNRRV